MLFQIESGEKDAPRKVHVETDDGQTFDFTADNLRDAHKRIKQGREEGWETVVPKKGK